MIVLFYRPTCVQEGTPDGTWFKKDFKTKEDLITWIVTNKSTYQKVMIGRDFELKLDVKVYPEPVPTPTGGK